MTTTIPNFALYGDDAQPAWLDMVHFEWIPERSSLNDFEIHPHFHDGLIQVLYITKGGGEVFIDGTRWTLYPQTLVVVPAGHVHGFSFRPEVDGPVVTAAQRPIESLAAAVSPDLLDHMRKPLVLGVPESVRYVEALMPLFSAIERESRMHASGDFPAGSALLMALMVQIARIAAALQTHVDLNSEARSRDAVQVERFRKLVDARFRDRLPVSTYAAEMGLSAGHLSRLCRDALGMSSLDVVNARIVHEAERELVYATLGIKQIAALLGFADEAYFGRFFKKQKGQTPTEFRDAARRRLAFTPEDRKR